MAVAQVITAGQTALLSRSGSELHVASVGQDRLGFMFLAGRPIGEPIVHYGPFVCNSRDEIKQAFADFQDGKLPGDERPVYKKL